MRCPKCRCEVGNQAVCPYCGATVYVGSTTWNVNDFNRNTLQVSQKNAAPMPLEVRSVDRRIRSLETKVNMLLVLQGGTFVLSVLALIIMALK